MPTPRRKERDGIAAPQLPSNLPALILMAEEIGDRATIAQCTLDRVDLTGISRDWVHFSEVVATGIILAESHLDHLRIEDTRVAGGNLANAVWPEATCYRAEFLNCRMTGLLWPDGVLENVRFTDCKGDLMQFFHARLQAVRFERCPLTGADFRQADLTNAVFKQCDLSGVDFTGATLAGADLRGCPIEGMRVGPQELRGATIDEHQARELIRAMGIIIADIDHQEPL
jgi:uncharacterized protein YjbI with pentapeptide repeats